MAATQDSQPSEPAIVSAGAADVDAVGRTLASAFQADPVFSWCLPDPERRAQVLPGLFALFTTMVLPDGDVQVTADGAGAALWVPPRRAAVPPTRAADFDARADVLVGDDGARLFAVAAMLNENHPTAEHRFLWFVGVRPEAQRMGRGSTLLTSMLDRCDREGLPAYLDATSDHNRRLYERHGFEVVGEHSVDGCPPLWAMWRDPT